MKAIKRVILTVKSTLSPSDDSIGRTLSILDRCSVDVRIDFKHASKCLAARGRARATSLENADALVVLGGDGTIFRAIRHLVDFSMPMLTVNRGAVGFLAESTLDDADSVLPELLAGKGIIDARALLFVEVRRGKKTILTSAALNEIVVSQGAIARLLDLRACVDGNPLTTFHADGLIVATPTGSTAYSLAAGGPIVHPRLSSIILTPLNPHSFSQKPLVLPGNSVIEIEVLQRTDKFKASEVSLTFDGQVYEQLSHGDIVRIKTHDECALFARRREDTFFETLRSKLKWGEKPGQ